MAENGAPIKTDRAGILTSRGGDAGESGDVHSPRTGASKAVSIVEPEGISPMMLGETKHVGDDFSLDGTAPKHRRAKIATRLKGRRSIEPMSSARSTSSAESPHLTSKQLTASPGLMPQGSARSEAGRSDASLSTTRSRGYSSGKELHAHISAWLEKEKGRRASSKAKRREKLASFKHKASDILAKKTDAALKTDRDEDHDDSSRRSSDASEGVGALEGLEEILKRYMQLEAHDSLRKSSKNLIRRSSLKKLRRQSTSSDTDYFDGEPIIPSSDAYLDNSKTLAYGSGIHQSPTLSRKTKETEACWETFKFEIVRLAHTLRLKGWRRVSMERSAEIDVERLSGALTNAVYVVSPPKHVPSHSPRMGPLMEKEKEKESKVKSLAESVSRRPPQKLLLRIYGPQVDHLIDRKAELAILARLCRKNIGPRMLGTFANGRFEQYLDSKTLKAQDLRVPETSRQIAKRMKELHVGVELTAEERGRGPFIWTNWEKWVERCEKVVKWVDAENNQKTGMGKRPSLVRRGSKVGEELVCGVEWDMFRNAVEKYRGWLDERYGGTEKIKDELVFAHNDTQYGNILRLQPPGHSPLQMPSNQHKQLVVIDFEYANANLPGLEFANHFTEWCYDYHDKLAPYACNAHRYPTPEEQHRFVKAYVQHRPSFLPTPMSTPGAEGRPGLSGALPSTSSLSAFMLDARTPGGIGVVPTPGPDLEIIAEEEEKRAEADAQRLLQETKLWRLANSAQWVAWGIVQAKVEGMPGEPDPHADNAEDETENANGGAVEPMSDPLSPEVKEMATEMADKRPDEVRPEEAEEGDEEFDYLAYAHERALFFWGDAIQVGLVKEEELPEGLRKRVKVLEY